MIIVAFTIALFVALIIIIFQISRLKKLRRFYILKNKADQSLSYLPQSTTCIVYDLNLTILKIINPKPTILFKIEPEKLIGKNILELEKITEDKYKSVIIRNKNNLLKTLSTKEALHYEYSIDSSNGGTLHVLCDIKYESNDQIHCYITTIDLFSQAANHQSSISDFLIRMAELLSVGVYLRSVTAASRNYILFNEKVREFYGTNNVTTSPCWNQEEEDKEDELVLQSNTELTFDRELTDSAGNKRYLRVTKQKLKNNEEFFYISTTVTELTELIRKNKTIKEYSLNLQLALDISRASVWGYDLKTKSFESLYGHIPFGTISFDECLQSLHPDSKETFIITMDNLISGKSDRETVVLHFIDPTTGKESYYKSEVASVKSKNGKVLKIIGIQKDISETIENKKKYNDLFNRQETILQLLPIGIEIYDKDGWLTFQNHVDREIFEIEEKIIKPNIFDNPNIDEHHKQQLLRGEDIFIEIEYNFSKVNSTNYYQSRNNGIKHLKINAKTIHDPDGKILFYICVIQDISEIVRAKKRIEENNLKLNIVINNSSILPWDYDCSKAIFIPYCAEDAVGEYFQTLEEYLQITDPEDHPKLLYIWDILQNNRNKSFNIDLRYKLPDIPGWQYSTISGQPFEFDKQGIPTKYTGYRKDTTEQKRIDSELQEAREIEQTNRLKSAFLANISHEIRTPLNAIVGFSDLLVEATDEYEKEEYKKIITINNSLLLNLINDILDLSKIESGGLEAHTEKINFTELFNELKISFSMQMKNGIELKCINPYASCITYDLDKQRVIQVITKLTINAIKFTTAGFITIGYEAVNNGLRIWVSDTGIGISEENKAKVFQRFQKLNTFVQGTGLGLSICKAIVDKMNGEIGFDSSEGKGTNFWVWLPCNLNLIKNEEN